MMSTPVTSSPALDSHRRDDKSPFGRTPKSTGSRLPTKLGLARSGSDSGIGSDSSDSMSDAKESFQEAIMNLKALNGGVAEAKESAVLSENVLSEKSVNCNGTVNDNANGKDNVLEENEVEDYMQDEDGLSLRLSDDESVQNDEADNVDDIETSIVSEDVSKSKSDDCFGEQSEELSEADCSEDQSKELSEDQSDGQSVMQSQDKSETWSQDLSETRLKGLSEIQNQSNIQSQDQSETLSQDQLETLSQDQSEVLSEGHSEVLQAGEQVDDPSEERLDDPSEERLDCQSKEVLDCQSEEVLDGQSEEVLDGQSEDVLDGQSEDVLDGQSEDVLDGQSEDVLDGQSEDVLDGQSEEVLDTQSPEPKSVASIEDLTTASDHPENIEIVESDESIESMNEESDRVNSILGKEPFTEKDEKSMDSGDHPLTIDDKVKKSVRDIMSKLKQGINPELTKLIALKKDVVTEVNYTEAVSKPSADNLKYRPQSASKGNLFENLTVIGVGTSSKEHYNEDDGANSNNDGKNYLQNSVEMTDSPESDIEVIEDADIDKQDDDDLILCDDPIVTSVSGNSKSESDFKSENDLKTSVKCETTLECTVDKGKPERNDDSLMEVDCEEEDDVKTVVTQTTSEKDESSRDSDSIDSKSDRKRTQEESWPSSGAPPKRSRLDMVIGKLGSQIGISPDAVKSDSCSFDDESHPDSEASDKSDNDSTLTDEEDYKAFQSKTKTIRISGKELDALVRTKVSAYLKDQHNASMTAMRTKIAELQEANNGWKSQAKDLQKRVVELTVLQQRLEKRKAATVALRQITTRSVGVQADENKTILATGLTVKNAKTPPKVITPSTNPSVPVFTLSDSLSSCLSLPVNTKVPPIATTAPVFSRNSMSQLLSATAVSRTSMSTSTMPGVPPPMGVRPALAQHLASTLAPTPAPNTTTVRSLLENTKPIDITSKVQTISGKATPTTNVIVVSSPSLLTSTNNPTKVIDLTSDDESAKGPSPSQPKRAMQVVPAVGVAGLRPALVPQQVVRGINPVSVPQPGTTSILLSSPAGLMNATGPGLTRPAGTYQIMTVASGSNLRPGTLLTVMPAGSPINVPNTTVRTTMPTVALTNTAPMAHLRPMNPTLLTTRPMGTTQTVVVRPPTPLQTTTVPVKNPTIAPNPTTSKHPAALPSRPWNQTTRGLKDLPPKPGLKISRVSQGIVLSWNMTICDIHADIASYQLFAYQEGGTAPSTSLWKKVGDVKALPLPMACTLTQFQEGNKYHFSVRAVDVHNRFGDFSDPSTIHLTPK